MTRIESRCRIGRVTLKGGCALHVIPGGDACPLGAEFVRCARTISEDEPDMSGFFMVAWDSTSQYWCKWYAAEGVGITDTMLPSWLADVMRKQLMRVIAEGRG